VIVVIEQTKGMTQPVVFFYRICQNIEKFLPVSFGKKYVRPGIAT